MTDNAIIIWLLDATVLVGLALLAACLVYGLLLAVAPALALRASSALNRRYSGRRALRSLEIPRESERFIYRHHRWVGGLLLAGVLVFFFLYFLSFPRDSVLARLGGQLGAPLADMLVESLTGFLLVANVLIGILALVMLWRPSLLKPVEAVANRWLSTRRALRGAEISHEPLDQFMARRPRLAGILISAATLYILASLLITAT